MSDKSPAYHRVLIKLSGEALSVEGIGISAHILTGMAREIAEVHKKGVDIAVVIGGGNIFRGIKASAEGMERAQADYMGMLATIINSLALQDAIEKEGVPSRVMSALEIHHVAEPYIRRRAIRHLEKGRVVIFAAGTGNPYFTTDTAAALRAAEIKADVILKATRVDGVYDKDPKQFPDAKRFDRLSYMEVLSRQLKVMDATAVSLCMDNSIPLVVFDVTKGGNLKRVIEGESVGTLVSAPADI